MTVEVVGAKLNKHLIKKLIPVYEEGAVDDDLLNEGDRSLRDYYQRAGLLQCKDHPPAESANCAAFRHRLHRRSWAKAQGAERVGDGEQVLQQRNHRDPA